MTLSKKVLLVTLKQMTLSIKNDCSSAIMLSVFMLSVFMLSVFKLNVTIYLLLL